MIDTTTPISAVKYNGVSIPIQGIPYSGTPSQVVGAKIDTVTPISAVKFNNVNIPIAELSEPFITFSSPNAFTLGVYSSQKGWDGTIEYSVDKSTWTEWDGTTTLNSGIDNKLYLRGTGNTVISGGINNGAFISSTGSNISVKGDIENLIDYATVTLGNHPTLGVTAYAYMFYGNTAITDCSQLIISSPTLPERGCQTMFYGCTSLVYAPQIMATTVGMQGCQRMFANCPALLTAPLLPATTLDQTAYSQMFADCTSISGSIDLTHIQALTENHIFGAMSSTFYPALRFGTNLTSMTKDNLFNSDLSATSLSIYYEFDDNDTPQFTLANAVSKGSSKYSCSFNIYTDNTAIKDAVLAQADQYTTVNVYKLNGGSW